MVYIGLRDWTKKKIYDPIQNVGKFSMSLVNYKKKTIAAQNISTKPTVKKTFAGQRSQSPTASLTVDIVLRQP